MGLVALERVPVREHTELHDLDGNQVGTVTSGLLAPSLSKPIALGYLPPSLATAGTRVNAMVRGKPVMMEVTTTPFLPPRYHRG